MHSRAFCNFAELTTEIVFNKILGYFHWKRQEVIEVSQRKIIAMSKQTTAKEGNGANARTPLLAASSTVVNDHVSNRNRYRFPMQQQLSYYLDNFQDAGLTRFEGKAPSDLEDGQQRRGRGRRIHGESSSFNDASVLNSISGLSGFRVSSVFFLMIACVVIVFTLVSGLCWSLAGGPVVHSAHADKHPDILTHASSASARHNDSSAEHLQAPTHTLFHTRSNSASISAMGEDRTLLPPFNSSVGAADRHLSTHHHQHHQPHHHRHDDEDTYKPAVTWDFLDLIANDNANDSHREARSKHKYKDNDQHRVKHQYKLQHRDDDGSGWKAGVKWKSGDVDHAMWNRTRNHTGAGGSNGWDDEDADPLQPLDIEWHCRWRIIKASIQMLLPLHHHRHLSDRDNSDGDNDENGNNNDNNDDTDSNNSTSLHQYQDRDHFHISNTTIKMGIKKKRIDCSKYNDEWKRDDVNVTADEERHEQEESESMKMILRLIDKTLKLRWGRKIERRLKDIKGEFKAAYDRDHPTSKNNDSDDNNDDDDYNHEDNTSPVHALYAQNFTHPLSYGCAGDHCSDGNMFADNRLIAPILSAAATSHSSRHLKERKKTEKRHEIEKKKKKKGKKKEDSKDKKKQRDQDGRKHKGGDNHNNVLLAHTNHSSTSTNASLSLSCHQEGTCRPPPGAVTSLTDALIHAYVEEGNHDCAKWAGLFTPDTGLQVSPIRSCRLPYALGDQALRLYCELRAQTFGFQTIYSFIDRAFVGTYLHDSNHPPHRNNQQQVGDGEGDENDNNDEKDNNDNNATATFFTNTHSHDNGDGNDTTSSTVPVALPTSRQVAVLYSVVGTWEGHKKKVDVITRLKLEEKHDEESDKSILTIDRATDYLTVNNLVCETIPLFKAIKPRDYESIIFRYSSFENGECNSWAKLFTEDGKVYLPATGHDPPRILHGRTELQQYCQATIDKYYQLQTIVMHHHPVLYQDLQSAIHYQFIVREDKDSSSTNLPVVAFLHFETYGLITESRIFCTRAP